MYQSLTLDECFDPGFWPTLTGFALIDPNDDILPVRAAYDGKTWGIGVNPLTSDEPLWYSLADCAASALLSGKGVRALRVIRLRPKGGSNSLRPVKLRGTVEIDPMVRDPMVTITEERQRVKRNNELPQREKDRIQASLKVVGSAGSYGIYSEFNTRTVRRGERTKVRVFGRKDAFDDWVPSAEDPGRYCFPPFASLITAAARLMLAMLERCVTDLGGTWVFCDTDSMAIVAIPEGGLVPCPGGPERMPDGREAVRALSYTQVDAIQARFDALSPYDRSVVPRLLKLEAESLCYGVSAKRYALYTWDEDGDPVFDENHPPSQHGLGHFLNPTDPDSDDRDWITDLWRIIVRRAQGRSTAEPPWLSRPTLVRTTVTSTPVRRAFRRFNEGRTYRDQIKPFNFLLTAAGAKPPASVEATEAFRLVAPYETDSAKWGGLDWTDVHHPEVGSYSITTRDGRPGMARVDTFGEVLAKYESHPESKSLGADGRPCDRSTIGLLHRRPVTAGRIRLIGKESNRIDERARGELTADEMDERITTYVDHDEWYRTIVPQLRRLGVGPIAAAVRMSERRVRDILTGRALPHADRRLAIARLLNGRRNET
jgi:hypothetical protein